MAPWGGKADELVGSQGEEAERQLEGDLCGSARPGVAGAELVVEPGVAPLDHGADAVSDSSDVGMVGGTLCPGLAAVGLLEFDY